MKTPREIYAQYRIMPSLQMHQLRVAAVAKMVCDSFSKSVDTHTILLECLFHDMGNIVKSDLEYFPDFVEPEGKEYWEGVKKGYLEKYGPEQHAANAAIAHEIGLPPAVIDIMNTSGFSHVKDMVEHGSLELMICQYADMRVGPRGVLSMLDRLNEGRERYKKRKHSEGGFTRSDEKFEELVIAAQELEKKIFADTSITPDEISDMSVVPIIEELWGYTVA